MTFRVAVQIPFLQRAQSAYQENRLAARLVLATVLAGLAVCLSLTLFLLKREYDRSLHQIRADLVALGKSTTPQLAANLWLVNTDAVQTQLTAMLQTRAVDRVELTESEGAHFSAGRTLDPDTQYLSETFQVAYLHPLTNRTVILGEMKLYAGLDGLRSRLSETFRSILLIEGVGLSVAALLFLGLYHRLIARHLKHITAYTRNFDYSNLPAPLVLSRQTSGKRDELQTLVNAFNTMRGNLLQGVQERDDAERALFLEKELAEVTLISITDAIITTTPEFRVKLLNPAAEKLIGQSHNDSRGQPVSAVLCSPGSELTAEVLETALLAARDGRQSLRGNKARIINRQGLRMTVEYAVAPIRDWDGDVVGMVLILHDVSAAEALTEKLAYQANHDDLTGLINRRGFDAQLNDACRRASSGARSYVLMLLDLDQFKLVNDTCGHQAGDELLRQVTEQLQVLVAPSFGLLGRLGGDEFGILLADGNRDHARQLAQSILHALQQYRFVWEGRPFGVTVSIGLVLIDATTISPQEAMSQADVACFAAKDAGRNRLSWYAGGEDDLQERHNELQLLATLREAIEQNRFRLYFQKIEPLRPSASGGTHLEILLRMSDAQGRIIAPGAFIPAAERYDMMSQVDSWVVANSIAYLASQQANGKHLPHLAINLSGKSLNRQTLSFILQQLDTARIPASLLCFEITETSAISNMKESSLFIETLRERGCRFALDDFGSGFSSFNYLKNLAVDYLKIDGSLVRDIANDRVSRQMVIAVNDIGHSLGMRTIAEFVENEDIRSHLAAIGVDFAQGYHIGKPEPLL
ncbi:EAL domain-containing protein [Chitinilyticum piscinae]|uniref:EAL domain-containing protein n=1 Tax=Chitinilyticum piscinae TaxID=2866724 RepID=A0A8J7KBE2_9NEIS|nr:EAL domain-containing protein [Chitinilyticum piscinae]MBE9610144.1 EAL domain-containing protein [Chitinilyticum piscinae]